jgi:hypothetical protein
MATNYIGELIATERIRWFGGSVISLVHAARRRPDRRRGSLNASFFSNAKAFVIERFCRGPSSRSNSIPSS